MIIIGLTGSIGMGKSTAAKLLRRMGVPVHDADATVHQLFQPGGAAVATIDQAFPGTVREGAVDRQRLGQMVLGDGVALKRLEAIVHPLVRQARDDFARQHQRCGTKMVVLDVPLLFETGGEGVCDVVIVVSASARAQRERVMARPGMNVEKFRAILAKQMPDAQKRRRADFVVPSALGFADMYRRLRQVLHRLQDGSRPRKRVRRRT